MASDSCSPLGATNRSLERLVSILELNRSLTAMSGPLTTCWGLGVADRTMA